MKKFLLLTFLILSSAIGFVGSANAQNVTCATRPAGDSSNACASTAFVANPANYNWLFSKVTTWTPPYTEVLTPAIGTYQNIGRSLQYGTTCAALNWMFFIKLTSYIALDEVCAIIGAGSTEHQFVGYNAYLLNKATSLVGSIPIQGTCIINTTGVCYGMAGIVLDGPVKGGGVGTISGNVMTITNVGADQNHYAVGDHVTDGLGYNATVPLPAKTLITYDGTTVNTACGGVQCTGTGGIGTYALSASATVSSTGLAAHYNSPGGNILQVTEFDVVSNGASNRSRLLLNGAFTADPGGNALGYVCTVFTNTIFPWDSCFSTGDGIAKTAMIVGQTWNFMGSTATPGLASQNIQFNATDNSFGAMRKVNAYLTPEFSAASGMLFRFKYPTTFGNLKIASDAAGGFVGMAANTDNATRWTTGAVYAASAYAYYLGNLYQTTAGGTSGASAPTCTSGTCSDGTVTWTYIGPTAIALIAPTGANGINLGASGSTINVLATPTFSTASYFANTTGITLASSSGAIVSTATNGLILYGYGSSYEITFANRNGAASASVSNGAGAPFLIRSTSAATSSTTGSIQIAGGAGVVGAIYAGAEVTTGVTTVGSLPTCNAGRQGARYFVTDANATTFASTVAAGGSNKVPVVCNATNWIIG